MDSIATINNKCPVCVFEWYGPSTIYTMHRTVRPLSIYVLLAQTQVVVIRKWCDRGLFASISKESAAGTPSSCIVVGSYVGAASERPLL
jgi:hypothetical protein